MGLCLRLFFSHTAAHGPHGTGGAREEQACINAKFPSTLVIAAAIIVAVRLAREDISLPTPRLIASVGHSISLAEPFSRKCCAAIPA